MMFHGDYGIGDRLETGLQIMSKRKKKRKAHRRRTGRPQI